MDSLNRINDNELGQLGSLVGATFRFLGGASLDADRISDRIVVTTEIGSVTIFGDIKDGNFEGFDDEYSTLEVVASSHSEVEKIISTGHLFRQFFGQTIVGIKVVDETITCVKGGVKVWTYCTAVSLVIYFESGFAAITKLGHHDEMLKVTYGATFDIDALPKTEGRFEEGIHETYLYNRELISIEDYGGGNSLDV